MIVQQAKYNIFLDVWSGSLHRGREFLQVIPIKFDKIVVHPPKFQHEVGFV